MKKSALWLLVLLAGSVLAGGGMLVSPAGRELMSGAAAPARPATVPARAHWVGGADGGVFVLVQPVSKQDLLFDARIWSPGSGKLVFRGQLRATDAAALPIRVDDPRQFTGWDGVDLYLRKGGSLRSTRQP